MSCKDCCSIYSLTSKAVPICAMKILLPLWNTVKVHLALKQNQCSKWWDCINKRHCPFNCAHLPKKEKYFADTTIKIFYSWWLQLYFTINCDLCWMLWNRWLPVFAHSSRSCFFGTDCICCSNESLGSWNDKLLQQTSRAPGHRCERTDWGYAVVKKWNFTNSGMLYT